MELILFLIVAGIFWFINQKFGEDSQTPPPRANQPQQGQQGQPQQQQNYGRQNAPQTMAEDERTRRIQEEIRRKIAERRGEAPPAAGAPPPLPGGQPAPHARAETAPATPPPLNYGRPNERQMSPEERAYQEAYGETELESSAYQPLTPEPRQYEAPPPVRDYEAELAEQQRVLEESHRRAEQARSQARARMEQVYGQGPRKTRTTKTYSGLGLGSRVRERLKDPEAAREAFVYLEVLGQPVGQRVNGKMGPSWQD